jgi:hypothetical protein
LLLVITLCGSPDFSGEGFFAVGAGACGGDVCRSRCVVCADLVVISLGLGSQRLTEHYQLHCVV